MEIIAEEFPGIGLYSVEVMAECFTKIWVMFFSELEKSGYVKTSPLLKKDWFEDVIVTQTLRTLFLKKSNLLQISKDSVLQ